MTSCPDLVTEDITRRLGVPLEAALTLLTLLGSSNSPTKAYSGQLKAPTATVRLRLLEGVSVLAPATLETSYAALLRLLVAEFCLADPTTTPTSTQLLPQLLHPDTELLLSSQLGAAVPDQLERSVEDQLAAVSAGKTANMKTPLLVLLNGSFSRYNLNPPNVAEPSLLSQINDFENILTTTVELCCQRSRPVIPDVVHPSVATFKIKDRMTGSFADD